MLPVFFIRRFLLFRGTAADLQCLNPSSKSWDRGSPSQHCSPVPLTALGCASPFAVQKRRKVGTHVDLMALELLNDKIESEGKITALVLERKTHQTLQFNQEALQMLLTCSSASAGIGHACWSDSSCSSATSERPNIPHPSWWNQWGGFITGRSILSVKPAAPKTLSPWS